MLGADLLTNLRRTGLRARLVLAMALLSVLVAGVAGVALWGVSSVRDAAHRAVQQDGLMSRLADQVAIQALQLRRFEKDLFLSVGTRSNAQAALDQWRLADGRLGEAIDAFERSASEPGDLRQAALWRGAHSLYREGFEGVSQAVLGGSFVTPGEAQRAFETYRENIATLTDLAVQTSQEKDARAQREAAGLEQHANQVSLLVLLVGQLAIVLAVAWTLLLPGWLARPLAALQRAAAGMAEGDFSVRVGIDRDDDLGRLARTFDQMAATLAERSRALQLKSGEAEQARWAADRARLESEARLATIEAQQRLISELSVPVLPLTADTLVLPLVGGLEAGRMAQVQQHALQSLEQARARFLILDITAVPLVDTAVAAGLMQIVRASRLLGTQVILAGIRPEVAQAIVGLGINLGDIVTVSTLEAAIGHTFAARSTAGRPQGHL